MALLTQTSLLQTIAYLMGERTVNSTTSTSRADFLQKTLTEVYQAYPWRFARTTTTPTFALVSSGVYQAALPSNYDNQFGLHLYYTDSSGVDTTLLEIDPIDRDKVTVGSLAYWIVSNGDGTFSLRTKDTAVVNPAYTLTVAYQQVPPTLDAAGTVGTPYPNAMTLALGARRFVKLSQNPDADISQDQAIFKDYLNQDIAAEQVPHARKRRSTRLSLTGRQTGDF